nr:ABC transporter related protein [uncultured bacterium]
MKWLKSFGLFRFLAERDEKSYRSMTLMIVIAGLSSGLLLGVVNHAAAMAAVGQVSLPVALLFVVTLPVYIIAKRKALVTANLSAESAIRDMRIAMSDKIRRSELMFLEKAGRGEIYARLTQDTTTISQCVPIIFSGYQSAVVIIASLIYMLVISVQAFVVTVVLLAIGAFVYTINQRQLRDGLQQAIAQEAEFFDSLSHLIDGFKEIKINRAKNDEVFRRVEDVSRRTESVMKQVSYGYVDHMVMSQTFFFLILAVLIFLLPTTDYSQPEIVLKLTAAILFMVSPLEGALVAWHYQMKADVALGSIERLERLLDQSEHQEAGAPPPDPSRFAGFSTLRLQNGVFAYPESESNFQVGPLNLEIRRGTSTFVVGGNGCGKSTLLKLLTGLYPLQAGRISLDDEPVTAESIDAYRELYTCIFSDFHLFDRLYGLGERDPDEVRQLIARMGLADKVDYRDGRFTNLDLSTGQRKRLALITSFLEDKPIYVFDEWAADQDVEFRARFYDEIIPDLTGRGKTVIAVTHDDRWYDKCDQLLRLDYGKLSEVRRPGDKK